MTKKTFKINKFIITTVILGIIIFVLLFNNVIKRQQIFTLQAQIKNRIYYESMTNLMSYTAKNSKNSLLINIFKRNVIKKDELFLISVINKDACSHCISNVINNINDLAIEYKKNIFVYFFGNKMSFKKNSFHFNFGVDDNIKNIIKNHIESPAVSFLFDKNGNIIMYDYAQPSKIILTERFFKRIKVLFAYYKKMSVRNAK